MSIVYIHSDRPKLELFQHGHNKAKEPAPAQHVYNSRKDTPRKKGPKALLNRTNRMKQEDSLSLARLGFFRGRGREFFCGKERIWNLFDFENWLHLVSFVCLF